MFNIANTIIVDLYYGNLYYYLIMKEKNQSLVNLGNNIRKFREAIGLSQEKLAALVTLHRNYVGQVERGEVNISYLNLIKLATTLEVGVEDLIKS